MNVHMLLDFIQGFAIAACASIFYASHLEYRKAVRHWTIKAATWAAGSLYIMLGTFLRENLVGIMGPSNNSIQLTESIIVHTGPVYAIAVNALIIFSFHYLLCCTLFSGSLLRKLFITLMWYVIIIVVEPITLMLLEPFETSTPLIRDTLYYAINTSFLLLLALLFRRYRQMQQLLGGNRMFLLQCIVPICSCLYLSVYVYRSLQTDTLDIVMYLLAIIFIAVINAIIYVVFRQQQKFYKEKYENLLLVQDYQHREDYYGELEAHHREIRIMRHDIRNQLLAAYEKSDSGELKDLLAVLDEPPLVLTGNSGLNQLISAKMRRAKESGIRCDFNIELPQHMAFKQMDLGALVGNIMDNAIEACQHSQGERVFCLELLYQRHALVIRCENSTDGAAVTGQTRKEDKRNHGFGMLSIERIVHKYSGTMTVKNEGDNFILEILLWEPR